MRVGIVRTTPWSVGGGFQYEMLLLEALSAVAKRGQDEILYLTDPDASLYNMVATGAVTYAGLPMRPITEPRYGQPSTAAFLNEVPAPPRADTSVIQLDRDRARRLRRMGVDWLFQLSQNPFAFETHMPFVMPIHDLQHRIQPEFPEVSLYGQTEFREYMYRNACRFATLVLVDSEQGKADVLRFYGELIDEDRIRVLPFFPPPRHAVIPDDEDPRRVAAELQLPSRFFFYPAQFWRHKNHHLIIEALRLIKERTGEAIPVVLSGSYADRVRAENFVDVVKTAQRSGVADQVSYVGWVPDGKLPALYRLAAGLVMPTFFGPTNLPTLEAWHYGCPVITSDVPGVREQTGDAALLIDPRSPEQLAEAMELVWRDPALAAVLVQRGRVRLATYDWDEFVARVASIVDEASARLRDGRAPRYPEAGL